MISENIRNRAEEMARRAPKPEPEEDDSWMDTPLMQPTEEWDSTDRKGSWGGKVFVHGYQNPDRYDQIDWSK